MMSINQDFFHSTSDMNQQMASAKFFLSNANLTAEVIIKGRLTQLDPIVGENKCQIRALAILQLSQDKEIQKEALHVKVIAKKFLKELNELQNKFSYLNSEKFLNHLKMNVKVSEKMQYLLRAHLLTYGKVFKIKRGKPEVAYIDYQVLKDRLSKQMKIELIKEVILIAQQELASQSTCYIQEIIKHLNPITNSDILFIAKQLQAIKQIQNHDSLLTCSCAFYDFKTVLLKLQELDIPLLLKSSEIDLKFYYKASAITHSYRQLTINQMKDLDCNQTLIVIDSFFSKTLSQEDLILTIEKEGLFELALANVAVLPQYSSEDDYSHLEMAAQEEINFYRELGKKKRCESDDPAIFKIVHVYAATMQEIKKAG